MYDVYIEIKHVYMKLSRLPIDFAFCYSLHTTGP